jgi:ADP-glucose pyrophosphorylase
MGMLTGLGPNEAKEKPYIASMGIYVFKKDVLTKLLGDKYPQVRAMHAGGLDMCNVMYLVGPQPAEKTLPRSVCM